MQKDFKVSSPAFDHTGKIPKKYTPQGDDVNPPLRWEALDSPSLKYYAIVVDDPDAPSGTFTHWLVKNISPSVTEIKEGAVPGVEIPSSWKIKKWKGPQPPSGTHRYFFKVYAVKDEIKADNIGDFYSEVENKKIGMGQIMGKYSAA